MTRHIVMMGWVAALALTAGAAHAQTTTERSGNSTSTITQEGAGKVERKVIKTPDGQKIIQRSGGNTATVTQKNAPGGGASKEADGAFEEGDMEEMECPEKPAAKGRKADGGSEDCPDALSAVEETLMVRRRALDSSDAAEPRRFGPGFERAQALKERMDALRRQ